MIRHRPLNGEPDFAAIVAFFHEIERAHPSGNSVSTASLRTLYVDDDPGWLRAVELWEASGTLVGMSEVRKPLAGSDDLAYVRFRVHPAEREGDLPVAMLAWIEETARHHTTTGASIESTSMGDDTWRIAVLERAGYTFDRRFNRLGRSLAEPFAPVAIPSGYAIRLLDPAIEVEAWVALYDRSFRDHYDFHPVTVAERFQRMRHPGFHADLDFVAEAPSGELAAFCVGSSRTDDTGDTEWQIDLVGTDPEHRRRGLAEVLLGVLARRLSELDVKRVHLWVDATSPTGADRLYDRLGFVCDRSSVDYRKRIS